MIIVPPDPYIVWQRCSGHGNELNMCNQLMKTWCILYDIERRIVHNGYHIGALLCKHLRSIVTTVMASIISP